jgi:hypothetical protein
VMNSFSARCRCPGPNRISLNRLSRSNVVDRIVTRARLQLPLNLVHVLETPVERTQHGSISVAFVFPR